VKLQTTSLNTDDNDFYDDDDGDDYDTKGANIFHKSRSHPKVLGSRKMP
jgi:hypothetical protein